MRNYFLVLIFSCFVFVSCNDGDVISVELDFDKTLTLCGDETSSNYILYDTKTTPFESLTLLFPNNVQADSIFNTGISGKTETLLINGNSVRFNYRTYSADSNNYICQDIPDASVSVTNNYEASSGNVIFTTTFEDDDNDGVPNALEFDGDTDGDTIPDYKDYDDDGDNVPTINEKPDPNGDGDLSDMQDTDGDSDGDTIPDYKDYDDDGDNVPTKDENPDPNGDGDLSDMQDTDGDSIPDYLDVDDDNDGTLTKFEDENNNGNLFDDLATGAAVARFLDITVDDSFESSVTNPNEFSRNFSVNVTLENIDISILSTDSFFLGTYQYTVDY